MTITVDGKTLEVGDTAVFRCGGRAKVKEVRHYHDEYNNSFKFSMVYFDDFNRIECKDNGKQTYFENDKHLIDIIDIEKAPKPEIITRYLCIMSPLHICNADSKENAEDYNKEHLEKHYGKIKLNLDKTNRKIISVEVVE